MASACLPTKDVSVADDCRQCGLIPLSSQEGLMALYRGWIPSVIGVVPYVGLNFAVYGTMKDVMMTYYGAPPAPGGLDGLSKVSVM